MLKPGDVMIVTTRGALHLRSSECDDGIRSLLANLSSALERDDARSRRDPHVDRALAAMAERPAHRWTVAALAKLAGLSRAAFARRFVAKVSLTPLQHLTALRMHLAAAALTEGDASIAEIAASVGYAEFAFAKAFKRHFGEAPGAFRRHGSQEIRASLKAA